MAMKTIERDVWINAPRERVWAVLTVPAELAKWLLPPAMGATMQLGPDRQLQVMLGPMAVELALMETSEPPTRLVLRGLPDRQLPITCVLAEENNGTRVTVTLGGLEALSTEAAADRIGPSGAGWEKALQNLKAHVEGNELPHPEGLASSLFGYRRETAALVAVERSIWMAAPRERVWNAITDPAQIQQWFSPSITWRQDKAGVGGRLAPIDPETGSEITAEIVDVFEPPSRYVTHTDAPPPSVPHVSTWTLTEENGGTRLTLTYSGYELDPVEARHNSMEQNSVGFGMMLQNLEALVAGRELPFPFGF